MYIWIMCMLTHREVGGVEMDVVIQDSLWFLKVIKFLFF